MIDDALLRPGRFDRIIYVPPPDFNGRLHIFKLYTKGFNLTESEYKKLALESDNLTGADIRKVCNEVILNAIRGEHDVQLLGLEDILKVLSSVRPSVSEEVLDRYHQFHLKFQPKI